MSHWMSGYIEREPILYIIHYLAAHENEKYFHKNWIPAALRDLSTLWGRNINPEY